LCDEGGGQRADEGLTEERVKAKSRTNPGTGGAGKAENRQRRTKRKPKKRTTPGTGGAGRLKTAETDKMKTGEAANTGNRRSR
jgi:hypothetical protein